MKRLLLALLIFLALTASSYVTGISDAFRFSTWAPSYGASGSMTFTSVTTNHARYLQIGKFVFFTVRATGTVGGTPSQILTFTLPVAPTSDVFSAGGNVFDNGSWRGCNCQFSGSGSTFSAYRYDSGNYTAGAAAVMVFGFYEVP